MLLQNNEMGTPINTRLLRMCLSLYRELNSKDPDCVCPVNPNGDGSVCGVPLSLDLLNDTVVNGLEIEVHQMDPSDDTVVVHGLDRDLALREWVHETVRSNANTSIIALTGSKSDIRTILWEGKIPSEHGRVFRNNCSDLVWSVEKYGVRVTFTGLSYRATNGRGRRRLLQNRLQGC